jgi:transposase
MECFEMAKRVFSIEFKHDTACLVVDQGYSLQQACETVGVGATAVRRWVDQLRSERVGKTPLVSNAMTPDQQRIQALEAKIRKIEREIEILKKATALLMSDSLHLSR